MTKAASSDGQKYRLAQAQKILDLFQEANGRPASNVRELEKCVASPEGRATLDNHHDQDGKIIP
jgi:hypothetical protein